VLFPWASLAVADLTADCLPAVAGANEFENALPIIYAAARGFTK